MSEREELLKLIRGAYYAEPADGTAESAWNAALEHIEEGMLQLPAVAATPARDATEAMALAGARSIGNTIHTDNHGVRARECWRAMWDARDGIVEPIPQGAPHSRPNLRGDGK